MLSTIQFTFKTYFNLKFKSNRIISKEPKNF